MPKSLSRSKCVSPDLVESEHLENRLTFVSLCLRHLPAIIAAVMLWTNTAFAQTTATYIGPNNGNWSNPANWDIGVVPINNGANTYNVIVPTGRTINFDVAGANNIAGLSLQDTGQINFGAGQSLNVTGFTLVAGNIVANGAGSGFMANSPLTVVQPSPELHATNGAVITVSSTSYINNRSYVDAPFLSAKGTGSRLNLQSITSLDSNGNAFDYASRNTIEAGQGGVIDLSGLRTVDGASGDDSLRFWAHTNGQINLDSLETISQTNNYTLASTIFEIESPLFSLPSLVDAVGTEFKTASGRTIDLPLLTSLRSGRIDIASGAIVNAPMLSNIAGTQLRVVSGASLNSAPLTTINDAELFTSDGGVITVTSTSYINNRSYVDAPFLSAKGTGSRLNLQSITSLDSNGNWGNYASRNTIEAGQGGVIDLSGLRTVDGASGDDSLRFWIHTNGQINLDSLETITRTNNITLASTIFDIDSGSLMLPKLTTTDGASFEIAPFCSASAPLLTQFKNGRLDIQPLATFTANNLTNIEGTYLRVAGGTIVNAPSFAQINDAELHAISGGQITVSATSYTNNRSYADAPFFSAIGTSSRLNLQTITSLNSNGNWGNYASRNTIEAGQSGFIDLSGLKTIDGASGDDSLVFLSYGSGRINIGTAGQTTNLVGGNTRFEVTGTNSVIRFGSSMNMAPNTEMKATLNGRFEAEGNLNISSTNPNSFDLKDGTLRMVGNSASMNGPQTLEVVSADIGLPSGALGNIGQIGRLQIGTGSISSRVILQDSFDNNLSFQGREALYLQGFPATNGLRIFNGSTLILNGQNAYTSDGQGNFTSLRSLIAPGQRAVAYDGGFISLTGEVGEVINGGFDSGDPSSPGVLPSFILSAPSSGGGGRIVSTPTPGNPNNKVAEIYAGSMVEMAQFVSTLDSPFRIEFDAMARHSTGELSLLLNNTLLDSWTWAELGTTDFSSFFVTVDDPLLRGLIDTKLAFRWNANTGHAVWLDNIRMTAVPEPGAGLVMLLAATGLSLQRRRRAEDCQKVAT
jgi:hypothetical protein